MPETQPVDTPPSETPTPETGTAIPIKVEAPDPHETTANGIIMAGVAATAGMGWIPAFVDIGWLVAANSGMVGSLALLYNHKWTADNVKGFIQRLIGDGGITLVAVKALSAALDLTGIGLPIGIAINGAMNGAITLAIGKSAQHYFKHQGEIPDDELIKFFRDTLRRGK
jgi:uncharacterized protein (DUF697 family)